MEPLLDQDMMRRLEQLTLVSRRVSAGRFKGERRSRKRGTSTDFADYRNYTPGDDIRFLDWRIYGRLERLFIKIFLEEEDLRVNVLLDTSPSMQFGTPEKLLYGKRLCAALGHICLSKMDSLTVRGFGDRLGTSFGPKRGKNHSAHLFEYLSGMEAGGKTALADSFETFIRTTSGKGVVVIISDFYDFAGYESALRKLFARDFEVLVLHVLSPQELEPEYQGDIRLVDSEFALTTDVSMGKHVMDIYRRTLTTFCDGIKEFVVGHGGYYLAASTATPFERLILDVLRRKGIIK